jgi:uncharacterized Zn-finger protein
VASDEKQTNEASTTQSRVRLTMKKQASATGENLCPSCGRVFEHGAMICVGCGLDIRTGKQFRTRSGSTLAGKARSVSRGFVSAVVSLLGFVVRVAIVVLLVIGGYAAYNAYIKDVVEGEPSSGANPGGVASTTGSRLQACPLCRGDGKNTCGSCGGFGTVDAVVDGVCDQCAGTGKYSLRMGRSKVLCPFCSGKGTKQKSTRVACKACDGTGSLTCTRCKGTGLNSTTQEQESTNGFIQSARDYFDSLTK